MNSKKLLAIAAFSLFGLMPALSSAQADQARGKSDEMRTQAEDAANEQSTRREGMSEEERAEIFNDAHTKAHAADDKGNDKAQEMRDRRDQRKEIMDAEKSDGNDSHNDDDDNDHADNDDGEGEGKAKEKKPWWKFWGD